VHSRGVIDAIKKIRAWVARDDDGIRPPRPDELAMAFELLPRDGPTWTALLLWGAIQQDPIPEPLLDRLCTPEFRGRLDVVDVRAVLAGTSVTNIPRYPAPDLAHVLFVLDQPEPIVVEAGHPTRMRAHHVSLVFRPEWGGWRVHAVGEPVQPEQVGT